MSILLSAWFITLTVAFLAFRRDSEILAVISGGLALIVILGSFLAPIRYEFQEFATAKTITYEGKKYRQIEEDNNTIKFQLLDQDKEFDKIEIWHGKSLFGITMDKNHTVIYK